jgi:hypothetical protein
MSPIISDLDSSLRIGFTGIEASPWPAKRFRQAEPTGITKYGRRPNALAYAVQTRGKDTGQSGHTANPCRACFLQLFRMVGFYLFGMTVTDQKGT